jgi:hypothetical protein
MKANGDMKDYSCCNMSVREDLSRRDLRLTVAVRCVHWTDLRGLCLDPAAHQSRRYSREVQLDWKRLQGLPLRLLLRAMRSHAAGQGGAAP